MEEATMRDPLPWDVLLGELPDGFHYQLPPRQFGRLRFVGLFLILSGLTGGGLLLAALLHAGGVAWPILAALAVVVLAGAHSVIRLGFLIHCGHSQIHLRRGRMTALEYAGLFLRQRSRPWDAVRRLTVTTLPLTRLTAIAVDCDRGGRLWLAPGYPVRILAPLARDLARRCARLAGTAVIPVTLADSLPEQPVFDEHAVLQERQEPPSGSRVRVEEWAGVFTVVVPPPGAWRGSRGLFPFALAWCAVLAFLTALTAFATESAGVNARGAFVVVLGGSWAVGLGLVLTAVARGRRGAVLTVTGDSLRVGQTGLVRTRHQEWARDELLEIVVGTSFRKEGDVPLLELKVWEFPGSYTGLLAGRGPAELAYIATQLRQALDLPLQQETAPQMYEAALEDEPVETWARRAS
jgi:hypothetical protein